MCSGMIFWDRCYIGASEGSSKFNHKKLKRDIMAYICIHSTNNMMLICFWFYRIFAIKGIMADFMDKTMLLSSIIVMVLF